MKTELLVWKDSIRDTHVSALIYKEKHASFIAKDIRKLGYSVTSMSTYLEVYK